MKLLVIFAFLALICMARTAPTPSTSARVLLVEEYHDNNDEIIHADDKLHDDDHHVDLDEDEDNDDDKTTTTTTTTRRSTFRFPTRNPSYISSRGTGYDRRRSTTKTTYVPSTTATNDQDETENEYEGDFKYIRDFRKYFQQLMEDIKKLVRNLTGYDFINPSQRQQYNQNEED